MDTDTTFTPDPEAAIIRGAVAARADIHTIDAEMHLVQIGDKYHLRWSDGISNWDESFDLLSVALARLAVLIRCAETDWVDGFDDAVPFVVAAESFFGAVTL